MKRIIEHGYRHYMETTCPACGCKFSYEWEDVIKGDLYHSTNLYTSAPYEIICPECGARFQLLNWTFHWSSEPIKFTCSCNSDGCEVKKHD